MTEVYPVVIGSVNVPHYFFSIIFHILSLKKLCILMSILSLSSLSIWPFDKSRSLDFNILLLIFSSVLTSSNLSQIRFVIFYFIKCIQYAALWSIADVFASGIVLEIWNMNIDYSCLLVSDSMFLNMEFAAILVHLRILFILSLILMYSSMLKAHEARSIIEKISMYLRFSCSFSESILQFQVRQYMLQSCI